MLENKINFSCVFDSILNLLKYTVLMFVMVRFWNVERKGSSFKIHGWFLAFWENGEGKINHECLRVHTTFSKFCSSFGIHALQDYLQFFVMESKITALVRLKERIHNGTLILPKTWKVINPVLRSSFTLLLSLRVR